VVEKVAAKDKEGTQATPGYFKIPNQKMAYKAKQEKQGKSLAECKALCDAGESQRCRSQHVCPVC
jgi:hypothetical protein